MQEFEARLDWARGHIQRFQTSLAEFAAGHPCQVTLDITRRWECPSATCDVTYRAEVGASPPNELRLIAGDAVHNLRATVDNLMWRLGKAVGAHEYIALPFEADPDSYARRAKKLRFERLPQEIQDWAEGLQPYRQGASECTLLHRLSRLSNSDKHRVPLLLARAAPSARIRLSGWLDRVDVLAEPTSPVTIVRACGDGFVNPEFSVELQFAAISEPAVQFLREVEMHVRDDVLPRFAEHL